MAIHTMVVAVILVVRRDDAPDVVHRLALVVEVVVRRFEFVEREHAVAHAFAVDRQADIPRKQRLG